MKLIFYISTLAIQFLSIVGLKLLDNFIVIIILFLGCLTFGIKFHFYSKPNEKRINDIGWGLFYGSITSLILTILFIIWLVFNFPQ